MKKIILGLLLTVTFISCKTDDSGKIIDEGPYQGAKRVYEVDGCEYIVFGYGDDRFGGHKGNCKFCLERNGK